jgi:hypothetical protein
LQRDCSVTVATPFGDIGHAEIAQIFRERTEGENWIYVLNMGEVIGKAFIPCNFKPTMARTGVLIFGPDGRVKKFNWETPTSG